ncbi:MAG: response regulator [Anaerolineae bacterium]|nr:response regulator [Anaerolineae bacterium]
MQIMGHKISLLLIANEDEDRQMIERLAANHYTWRSAATGREGLAAAQAHLPDLVLLDYRLPDITGADVLAALVARNIPVIALIPEENPAVIAQVLKQGAQDYLPIRPLSALALQRAIENVLQKETLKRALVSKNRQLAEQNKQISRLVFELSLAEQRERQRISQVLHEEIQPLLLSSPAAEESPLLLGLGSKTEAEFTRLVKQIMTIIKSLTVELPPPLLIGEGLDIAFEWLAEFMKNTYGLQVKLNLQAEGYIDPDELQILLFQFTRELLFNIVKHAKTNEAELEMWEEHDDFVIQVTDRGAGFQAGNLLQGGVIGRRYGLFSIRERLKFFNGRFEIQSNPDRGTRVTIRVPRDGASLVKTQP